MPNKNKKGTQKDKRKRSSAPPPARQQQQQQQLKQQQAGSERQELHATYQQPWFQAPPPSAKSLRGLAEHLVTRFNREAALINGDGGSGSGSSGGGIGDIDFARLADAYLDTQYDLEVLESLEPSDLDQAMESAEFVELVRVFRSYFQDMNRMGCDWPPQGAVRLATAQWFSSCWVVAGGDGDGGHGGCGGRHCGCSGRERSPGEMRRIVRDIQTSYLHIKMDSWNNLLLAKANAMVAELRDMQAQMEKSLDKLARTCAAQDEGAPVPVPAATSREGGGLEAA
ncbi:hypothetical protein N3K66_007504 [Trichothecium roseum]|uniref:Uncharacterized protein n=1 Tax=Trichothecium roseum TaxID=47278 RepID=A0ACC0UU66_9HYPO|nr:hypothetical protein N3K66_007504 [Trichothecium roseum]